MSAFKIFAALLAGVGLGAWATESPSVKLVQRAKNTARGIGPLRDDEASLKLDRAKEAADTADEPMPQNAGHADAVPR